MNINIDTEENNLTVLSLSGKIDTKSFNVLQDTLRSIDVTKDLMVMCDGLTSLDASGLTAMCSVFMSIKSNDKTLYINNINGQPRALLKYLNIMPLFEESVDESDLIIQHKFT